MFFPSSIIYLLLHSHIHTHTCTTNPSHHSPLLSLSALYYLLSLFPITLSLFHHLISLYSSLPLFIHRYFLPLFPIASLSLFHYLLSLHYYSVL